MAVGKTDLAIVNRTFWPDNQMIGEALLQFAEKVAQTHKVCVITQSRENLKQIGKNSGRGGNVRMRACRARTDSASGFIQRALESLYFMVWVLFSLLRERPRKVYVATDPPVLVPFIAFLYCKTFRADYYYHLQDIHPETANIVIPLNRQVLRVLRWMDNITIRNATALITLSTDMRDFILQRSGTKAPIHLLDNAALYVDSAGNDVKTGDIVFCGNAGRLQRIPLLMTAIRAYSQQGGKLRFTFVGGGLYLPQIVELAQAYDNVEYLGYLPAAEAAAIVKQHRWALLPIDDEVTQYAFPSKSSSYVLSGCGIMAICSSDTSVARWVAQENLGITCEPENEKLVQCFRYIERLDVQTFRANSALLKRLEISTFVDRLMLLCEVESD
ncbi:putative glycosyl transferase [Marinobacterium sp. xm-g-59]|uniref:glycosyltransferase n=1 Tax=Marinobacterium sp. xm-g-59 TaxID=2497748 RepID=UPI001567E2D1|nr:glycosyltransferase [Marinobacterium sp. xm-g-59]NRP95489.1 putative glycosyl transferase [Marinobacterium sp. xm-g-59]